MDLRNTEWQTVQGVAKSLEKMKSEIEKNAHIYRPTCCVCGKNDYWDYNAFVIRINDDLSKTAWCWKCWDDGNLEPPYFFEFEDPRDPNDRVCFSYNGWDDFKAKLKAGFPRYHSDKWEIGVLYERLDYDIVLPTDTIIAVNEKGWHKKIGKTLAVDFRKSGLQGFWYDQFKEKLERLDENEMPL